MVYQRFIAIADRKKGVLDGEIVETIGSIVPRHSRAVNQ